jgi:anti-sigma B factor antagonist
LLSLTRPATALDESASASVTRALKGRSVKSQNADSATPAVDTACNVPAYSGLGVTERWVERTVVVAVSGDLDMLTAPELAEAIQAARRKAPAALIVDLSRVEFLASAGMNLLMTAYRDTAPSARFGVVADGPTTSRPLQLIGLDTIFAIYRTLDDALSDVA